MKPRTDIAIKFFKCVRPRGPWTLTALHPDRVDPVKAEKAGIELDPKVQAMRTETFTPKFISELEEWLERWNATHGIYFHSNPATKQAFHRRARQYMREDGSFDVAAFQYVAADLDPPKGAGLSPEDWEDQVRGVLNRMKMKPTLIWRSGYGMQVMWRIKPAVAIDSNDTVKACRAVSKGMQQFVKRKLGLESDSVGSLEHLFRVPGTINHPNKSKRDQGRVAVLAGDFTYRPDAFYDVAAFPHQVAKEKPPRARGLEEPVGGWDTEDGIGDAIAHCQTTKDVACEGKSGTALRTACRMRDFGLSEVTAFEVMWEHWMPRCEYAWDEEELEGKIKRAYHIAENDPGCATIEYKLAEVQEDFKDEPL